MYSQGLASIGSNAPGPFNGTHWLPLNDPSAARPLNGHPPDPRPSGLLGELIGENTAPQPLFHSVETRDAQVDAPKGLTRQQARAENLRTMTLPTLLSFYAEDAVLNNGTARIAGVVYKAGQIWDLNQRTDDAKKLRGVLPKLNAFLKALQAPLKAALAQAPELVATLLTLAMRRAQHAVTTLLDGRSLPTAPTTAQNLQEARTHLIDAHNALVKRDMDAFAKRAHDHIAGFALRERDGPGTDTDSLRLTRGEVVLRVGPANLESMLRTVPGGKSTVSLSIDRERLMQSPAELFATVDYPRTADGRVCIATLSWEGNDGVRRRVLVARAGDQNEYSTDLGASWKPLGRTSDLEEKTRREGWERLMRQYMATTGAAVLARNRVGAGEFGRR